MTRTDAEDLPFEELGRSGFALALQMLRHREDAADALQDAVHAARNDLSYGEIAQVLSLPKGTVMSRLHRARQQLARRLREVC